jgi:hypothetical protein
MGIWRWPRQGLCRGILDVFAAVDRMAARIATKQKNFSPVIEESVARVVVEMFGTNEK